MLGAVDTLSLEETTLVGFCARGDFGEGDVEAGFAFGVGEEVVVRLEEFLAGETVVEEGGGEDRGGVGHGAEKFLGAQDFGGGEVGAARGVVGDEDAELAEAGLFDGDGKSVVLFLMPGVGKGGNGKSVPYPRPLIYGYPPISRTPL